jgi:hypothetical protein
MRERAKRHNGANENAPGLATDATDTDLPFFKRPFISNGRCPTI